jgi:ribokinase
MFASIDKHCKICVIGSINIDLVTQTPRFAQPGETIAARSWRAAPGGKGANQAVAAARLGASVTFGGRLGEDDFGAQLYRGLSEEGIDVAQVKLLRDSHTGAAFIAVDDSGNNSIYVVGGANHRLGPNDVNDLVHLIAPSKVLLLQLEIPVEATLEAIKLAHQHGTQILLDPAPAPVGEIPSALLKVDLLTPNESEAESLTGISMKELHTVKQAAIDLARRGATQVVIKLGSRGAVSLDGNGDVWHIEAYRVPIVDTTAAGDAFSAALGVAIASGVDLISATGFACAAGAIAVTKPGAQTSMPTIPEVRALQNSQEIRVRAL